MAIAAAPVEQARDSILEHPIKISLEGSGRDIDCEISWANACFNVKSVPEINNFCADLMSALCAIQSRLEKEPSYPFSISKPHHVLRAIELIAKESGSAKEFTANVMDRLVLRYDRGEDMGFPATFSKKEEIASIEFTIGFYDMSQVRLSAFELDNELWFSITTPRRLRLRDVSQRLDNVRDLIRASFAGMDIDGVKQRLEEVADLAKTSVSLKHWLGRVEATFPAPEAPSTKTDNQSTAVVSASTVQSGKDTNLLNVEFGDGGQFEIVMNGGINYALRQKRLDSAALSRFEKLFATRFQAAKDRKTASDIGDISPFYELSWVMVKVSDGAVSFSDYVDRLEHELFDVFLSQPFGYSADKMESLYIQRGFPSLDAAVAV